MSESLCYDLPGVLVLPLPSLGVFQSKAVLENAANSFQVHSFHVGVEENDEQPPDEANTTVEAESTTWGNALHHRQEGRGDDDVGRPASDGVEHSSESADFERNELGADPCYGCYSGGIHCNIDDDSNEHYTIISWCPVYVNQLLRDLPTMPQGPALSPISSRVRVSIGM